MAMIPLGLYLWRRIAQLGTRHVFGVPGDFNLTLLDHISSVPNLSWVGSANELNAAYSADGYARAHSDANVPGVVVTTHGVGELSALNAIGGALAESVKVIHVVGQTPTAAQRARMMLHHSTGPDPDHGVFARTAADYSVAVGMLRDAETASTEIDRVLRECMIRAGPVYIYLPFDLVGVEVPVAPLETELDLEPEWCQEHAEAAVSAVLQELYTSNNPCLLVDGLVGKHSAGSEAKVLAKKTHLPVFTTIMGKGIIDETENNFIGVYNGTTTEPNVAAAFEACDLVIVLGDIPCDTNTAGFTRNIKSTHCVKIDPFSTTIREQSPFPVPIKRLMHTLTAHIDTTKLHTTDLPLTPPLSPSLIHADSPRSQPITQDWLWPFIINHILRTDDLLLAETGTASFGLPSNTLRAPNIQFLTQTFYGSIGWATPAAFGAEMALMAQAEKRVRDRGRTVLVTGDGSLLLTLQEVGSMVRYGARTVVFIINNSGYTLERVIHGAHQSYNDVMMLDYAHLLPLFGMPPEMAKTNFHKVTTTSQLRDVVEMEQIRQPTSVQVVEIVVGMLDIPWQMSSMIGAIKGPAALQEMREAGFKVVDPRSRQHA